MTVFLREASSVTESYDSFINSAQTWGNGNMCKKISEIHLHPSGKLKMSNVNSTEESANVNILEGIPFYVGFLVVSSFGELKAMEGSSKIISLI